MNRQYRKRSFYPLFTASMAFVIVMLLTQFIAYQQYEITKKREHEALLHELSNVKDKFRNILYSDKTAANILGIMYKENGYPKNFDLIAAQIIKDSKYAEVIQLTKGGVIANVYPLKGYENTIGINTLKDSVRWREANNALKNNEIYFAGPRKLRQGGFGILGKVPIIADNGLKGFCVVLTKLATIKKALVPNDEGGSKFACSLTKDYGKKNQATFALFDINPSPASEIVSAAIPEGDWRLNVSYSENYFPSKSPYKLGVFGFLLSVMSGLLAYRLIKQKQNLQKSIADKTHQLNERVKELSTIYKINTVLQDEEQNIDEMFTKIVNLIPPGWQYPELCQAKIAFEDKIYTTPGFIKSDISQTAAMALVDGRKGRVEVFYTLGNPISGNDISFLEEEQSLIESIAQAIEIYLNKSIQKDALNSSEEKFRVAFDTASIGMAIVSLDGRWVLVNNALCEMVGYEQEELLSLSFKEITHPKDVGKDLRSLKQLLTNEREFYRVEKRYIHKNRSIVWVKLNVTTIKDKYNRAVYFVSQIENISERVESQTKFRDLVEKSKVGVFILQDGKFVYVNPQIIEESGYTEEEILGSTAEDFICEEDLLVMYRNLEERLKGEKDEIRYEVRMQKKDGSQVWGEIFSSTTVFQGTHAIIGTLVNITDKKILELERQKIITDLTQKNQDLEQFSFIVSHNMRAPIANLLGLTSLLEDQLPNDELKIIHEAIKKSSISLDNVVQDVNEILNVKGDLVHSKVEINFEREVEKISSIFHNMITHSNAKIITDFSRINTIHSVPAYIHSIFINIISNGLKYGKEGVSSEISIWTENSNGTVKIYFKDNGIGIDLARHGNQMFGLYKRFNQNKEGKGMGLFMTKTQVNALNGEIEVYSEPNQGTTFKITLPLG